MAENTTANGFYVGDKVELPGDSDATHIEEILVQTVSHFDPLEDGWFECSVVKLRNRDSAYLDCNLTRVE